MSDRPSTASPARINRFLTTLIFLVSTALTLFHLYLGVDTDLNVLQQRIVHVFAIMLVWYLYKCRDHLTRRGWLSGGVYVLILLLVAVVGGYYLITSDPQSILERGIMGIGELDALAGLALIALVLLTSQQAVGLPLTIIAGAFLAYALLGPYMPEMVAHKGYDLEYITSYLAWTLEGLFGTPIGASVSFVSLYIIFGELLDQFGAGKFFIDIAYALTGRMRGGPAEAAVLSSAMMGSINGSAVANVVTTGTFTIPLMKRVGYQPHYAGAVEAVASTGGQILPPVMGAAAFVMADMTGTPYANIVLAGLLPGILYYLSLGLAVYLQAGSQGLKGERRADLPRFKEVFKAGYYHLVPIAVLVYLLLIVELSANYAAIFAIAVLLVVGIVKTLILERRLPLREIKDAFVKAAATTAPVAAACASAGLVIGIVSMTGIGVKFTQIVFDLSGNNLFLMLLMVMTACIVLGMGLPSTAAYVIAATVGAPALVSAGVQPLAANMFVFYFAIISFITPPVAIAAYAGAGIAKSNPTRTGFTAFRLGFSGFVIPFIYVYHPALLIVDTPALPILAILGLSLLAVVLMATALEGWAGRRLNPALRLAMLGAAVTAIMPQPGLGLLGATACVVVIAFALWQWPRTRQE
ncbi:MAG: TRAP transporter fused permease subunit [Desulfarculus sp.]|nr:TRAP transporter fused permease subunit [Desulfarculus sp.]